MIKQNINLLIRWWHGSGNKSISNQKKIYRKFAIREKYKSNVKGVVSNANPQKMNLMIPSTSYSKPKAATMIRKNL